MTDWLSLIRSNPWLVAPAVGLVLAFFGTLLWKIIRSPEGFLLGYGNWIFGKWQTGNQAKAPPVANNPDPVVPEPAPKRDVASLKRTLVLKGDVLHLSRTLDGDLAYLMMHDAGEWEPKIARSLQTLVSGVTRIVHPAGGKCRCGFFILGDSEDHLMLAVGEGYTGKRRPQLALESCAGRAFLTGEDYYCRDVLTDPVYWQSDRGSHEFRSIACVPVRAGQSVFGVICLDAEHANAFTPDDFLHLEVFANKLAVFCAFHALQVGLCDSRF